VIQCPTTTEEWTAIAEQLEERWQFPHGCGALDGKHMVVTCPVYRNYKGFFFIVLMALVDTDYNFSGLMSALMVPATMPVSTMGQN
jgi:trehalose-6-phosphatase